MLDKLSTSVLSQEKHKGLPPADAVIPNNRLFRMVKLSSSSDAFKFKFMVVPFWIVWISLRSKNYINTQTTIKHVDAIGHITRGMRTCKHACRISCSKTKMIPLTVYCITLT